jgi:hypothetical protein
VPINPSFAATITTYEAAVSNATVSASSRPVST